MNHDPKARALELLERIVAALLDHASALTLAAKRGDKEADPARTDAATETTATAYAEWDRLMRLPELDDIRPLLCARLEMASDQFDAAYEAFRNRPGCRS